MHEVPQGTLALQRGHHPGMRLSAACFTGWLQGCVKPLHPVISVKALLSMGLFLGALSKPPPQTPWDAQVYLPGILPMSFAGLSQCIPQPGALGPAGLFLLSEIPLPLQRGALSCLLPGPAAQKAAGGLPAPAVMPRKAGLSRIAGGPVTPAPLTAELMEAPKLRELASASLPSPSPGGDLGFGLIPVCQGEVRGTGHGVGTASPYAAHLPGGMSGNRTGLILCQTDQRDRVPAGAEGSLGGTCLPSSLWVRNQLSLAAPWVGCAPGAVLRASRDAMPSADRAASTRGFL